ncbi:MAG: hypothetical protein IT289_10160 [Oligoflexia bacterium]|nr:hypothetical protein [Oligoflexia bacterium]
MLKIGIIFAFSMMTGMAWATPQPGDFVQFQIQIERGAGVVERSVLTRTIKSFDEATNFFTLEERIEKQGEAPTVQTHSVAQKQFPTDQALDQISLLCETIYHGVIEKIRVPAGEFETCAVDYDNGSWSGTVWMGKLPISPWVKVDARNRKGERQLIEALSFYY